MIQNNIGELAAIGTALSWTIVGLIFGKVSTRIGSASTNFYKLIFGFIMLTATAFVTRGLLFPTDASLHNWIWLTISGVLGFFVGDYFMLKGYIEVGVRVSMVLMAASPPMAAILGFILLHETLSATGLLGMFVTIAGIIMVILSKDDNKSKVKVKYSIKGLAYALIGVFGNAAGMVFSKVGLGDYNVMAATQIRIIAGFLSFLLFVTIKKEWPSVKLAIKDKEALKLTFWGSFFGPFIGVNLSLTALKYTSAGIATTLTSITPVTIIPFSITILKEKVKVKEIIGAAISVIGIAILLLI
ncbi:MAG: DMT family transporter [Gudongella sp.]|jgi:drug/metabolite transporter (DMT)-like permease|nr:DMT family transporter [Gudongella sp.]